MSEQPLSVADVLERAADLIKPEGAWCQGVFARDKNGNICSPFDKQAVSFCAVGALDRIADPQLLWDADGFFRKVISPESPGNWNDAPERTQAEVVAKFLEAAAIARTSS